MKLRHRLHELGMKTLSKVFLSDIERRDRDGKRKYRESPDDPFNGDTIEEGYQEAADGFLYLEEAIDQLDSRGQILRQYPWAERQFLMEAMDHFRAAGEVLAHVKNPPAGHPIPTMEERSAFLRERGG